MPIPITYKKNSMRLLFLNCLMSLYSIRVWWFVVENWMFQLSIKKNKINMSTM